MEWKSKDRWYIQSGGYRICWTGHPRPIFSASFRDCFLAHKVMSRAAAKKICEEHRKENERTLQKNNTASG